MTGTLTQIDRGADFHTFHFLLENGSKGRTYTGPKYKNFVKWRSMKENDVVEGLYWKKEDRGLLDADSPVRRVQMEA
jgi:hypothetical protein